MLKGVAELDDAALAAVRQWRFEPVLLNGEPVPVIVVLHRQLHAQVGNRAHGARCRGQLRVDLQVGA